MSFNDFLNKLRQFDKRSAQLVSNHFYILIFQIILFFVFGAVFINNLSIIDIGSDIHRGSVLERLSMIQTVNTLLITLLILFNSFWTLYIFGTLLRLRNVLRNIDFNLSRRRTDQRNKDSV